MNALIKILFIIGLLFISKLNLYSQNQYFGIESNLSISNPRKLDYSLTRRFIQIYSDDNTSKHYLHKEGNIGLDIGIISQIKLLKYWNLIGKLKYAQTVFTGWHNYDSKIINTSKGEDKIFYFQLDRYKIHQLQMSLGINCHYKHKIYLQFSPYLIIPFSTTLT